jgi:hypothetical protein
MKDCHISAYGTQGVLKKVWASHIQNAESWVTVDSGDNFRCFMLKLVGTKVIQNSYMLCLEYVIIEQNL